jgi:hypothetical protein
MGQQYPQWIAMQKQWAEYPDDEDETYVSFSILSDTLQVINDFLVKTIPALEAQEGDAK